MTWEFVLYLLSVICFFIAFLLGVVGAPQQPSLTYTSFSRINWLALGLLFFVLVPLIHAGQAMN